MTAHKSSFPFAVCAIVLLCAAGMALAARDTKQQKKSSDAAKQPTAPAPQNSTTSLPPLQLDGSLVLQHLNQAVSWYRHATTGIRPVGLATDTIYQDNTQNLGREALQLAFQAARAESSLITQEQKAAGKTETGTESSQQQSLAALQSKTSSRIDQLQSQIDGLKTKIDRARGTKKENLISQRDALQGELDLQKALLDAVQKMAAFVQSNGESTGGLEGSINQLARTIPEVLATGAAAQKPTPPANPSKPTLATSGGLISDAMTLYDYMSAVHQINLVIRTTDYTRDSADQMRAPLRTALRSTIQQSDQMAGQAPVSDPQQIRNEQKNYQQLTDRFKQLTAVMLPLSQEIVVLQNAKTNLDNWRTSIERESRYILRSVMLRVLTIAIALAVILLISEVWRRVTFRYISDPRRRRQFLVVRRIVVSVLVVLVLIMGFVSEFSSLATMAGFITAGIAVALQGVLLSVAAYFFIIGRYGIRIGDRISVSGVTGDVVDVGLVRLYLAELAGTGIDFYPTGRIVVFSNAVLFQTTTPLFKQIPGTEYSWHEVVFKIAPEGNHKAAEEKLVAAVNSVYSKYQHEIERQHATVERRIDIQIRAPKPESRLQFADDGLELLVRYPVEIRRAPDIDEEMTLRVLELIRGDAALKSVVSGTPKIRSAIRG